MPIMFSARIVGGEVLDALQRDGRRLDEWRRQRGGIEQPRGVI
jgi:hypothetical protein